MMSFECMCVILLEEIYVQIYQMTEVGISNKENCEIWGSETHFIGDLKAIVKCNSYKPSFPMANP